MSGHTAQDDSIPTAVVIQQPIPISQQDQRQVQALKRQVAIGFKNIIRQCRIALKYSVIGWTGTLSKDKISSSLANSPSIGILNQRMDVLDKALEPFLLAGKDLTPAILDYRDVSADTLSRLQYIGNNLLDIKLGDHVPRHLRPILDEIENDARVARILPPENQNGWAWSWVYDDWFRWDVDEKKWVGATQGWRVNLWA